MEVRKTHVLLLCLEIFHGSIKLFSCGINIDIFQTGTFVLTLKKINNDEWISFFRYFTPVHLAKNCILKSLESNMSNIKNSVASAMGDHAMYFVFEK